jgi:hypothetical protein
VSYLKKLALLIAALVTVMLVVIPAAEAARTPFHW